MEMAARASLKDILEVLADVDGEAVSYNHLTLPTIWTV